MSALSLHEQVNATTTTKGAGARGRGASNAARKVGKVLIKLGDRAIRIAEDMLEIPKTPTGKLLTEVLTGSRPTGRGEWARVSFDEINRDELGQMIAALSAVYLAMPSDGSPDNPIVARLVELGLDDRFARQIAAEPFYTLDYINAHWRDITGDPNVSNNPCGLLRWRLTNRIAVAEKRSDADRFKYDGWDIES